jgi:predicted RNA-binding protein with PIN domain
MEYLLIDAYNVINSWDDIFDMKKDSLEDCRDKLLNILSNYQGFKNVNIYVVFDAHMVKGKKYKEETFDNLTVVFTKENQTADNYIERFVYNLGNIHTIRVVTADYLEQTMILRSGGARMTPKELREEIKLTTKHSKPRLNNKKSSINGLFSNVDSSTLEELEKLRRS